MSLDDNDITKLKTIFATKDDLKRFATKDDLKRFATKDEARDIAQGIVDQLAVIIKNSIDTVLTNHEHRIRRLENRGVLPPLA